LRALSCRKDDGRPVTRCRRRGRRRVRLAGLLVLGPRNSHRRAVPPVERDVLVAHPFGPCAVCAHARSRLPITTRGGFAVRSKSSLPGVCAWLVGTGRGR
jgi:hypothetical protein